MGFSTQRIDVEVAKLLAVGGEVVSASKVKYFDSYDWKRMVKAAEIKDDGRTIFFQLVTECFVEYNLKEAVEVDKVTSSYIEECDTCHETFRQYRNKLPNKTCKPCDAKFAAQTNDHYNYHY
jgi:formylmethanofuran dehydrogenase subunit E